MVCGHLDRNALARLVTDLLAGDLANLVTSSEPAPVPGPRCDCDEHPPAPRAPIPGALPTTTARPASPSPPRPASPPPPASPPRPASPPPPGPVPPGLTGTAAAGTTAPGTGTAPAAAR